VRARAAASSVLEFGGIVHSLGCFCFFILWKSFCFCLCFSSGGYWRPGCCFRLDPDCPDEAQQFASYCSDDLSLILSGRCQPAVALVQPVLCLPGYLLDLFRNSRLSLPQRRSDAWSEPVAPGRFDCDASQVCVARLGDTPASRSLAAGVLTWHNAAVTHELPSTFKAGELAQLCRNRYRRDMRDAAQCL
jgi:hypothetical protein